MSNNENTGLQIRQETVTVLEGKPEETKPVKLCTICHTKPTISASSNICPSCMAKKASEKTRLAKIAANGSKPKETKEDKGQVEKTVPRPSQAVTIDFSKYAHVLKQVADLAENEMRPLDLQIIYLLKRHFDEVSTRL